MLLNIIWLIVSGIPLALGHALWGLLLCITVVGIPFGLQHFKLAQLRKSMDSQNVACQFAELGKADVGGGGTIAYIMANYGMEVVDSGVAVLCMHAPWEITSKADVYEAYKGYKAFIEEMD